MSASRRLSLGGASNSAPFGDASSRNNTTTRGATPLSRRTSLGGAALRSETPKKDRRALLDEWRRQSRRDTNETNDGVVAKKARTDASAVPPLPPSNASFVADNNSGSSAVQRIARIRQQLKEEKQQQQQQDDNSLLVSHHPPTLSSSICYDDSDEPTVQQQRFAGTPSRRSNRTTPGSALRGGARRRSSISLLSTRPSSLLLPPTQQEPPVSDGQLPPQPNLSQLTVESEPIFDTVEGAGLRSRVREMQLRVQQLEQEKQALLVSKAPLEDSFRRSQDAWFKEQTRLESEIDALKRESRLQDERYRDLQLQHEALQEQCTQLRHQVRMATSTSSSSASSFAMSNSGWSRQLQNDRDVAELKTKLQHAQEEQDALRLTKVSVEKELHATKIELDSLTFKFDEVRHEYEALLQSTSDQRDAEIQLQVLTTEHIATSAQLNAVCSDLAATKARAEATLDQTNQEHKQQVEQLQFEMSVLKTRAANTAPTTETSMSSEDDAVLRARIEERDRRIQELEAQVSKGEELRRQMHNRIQELRGNIRVFVRTRPFLPSDGTSHESAIDVSPDGERLDIVDHTRSDTPHNFRFDKVFAPSSGQDSVFQEVSDFVQSALDGYHVCLFSYGQTGSGKTHTMQGSGNGAMRGIIPRAVEQILAQAKVLAGQKWTFRLEASFLEIYNEELKDLLVSMKNGNNGNNNNKNAQQQKKLAIKRNREGKSYVENLTHVGIETQDSEAGMQQLNALMAVAARARSVASTKMNAQSSRSHSVFMLHLQGTNDETGAQVQGALNLCDLAGSERLDRSGANNDAKRLKETQAINKSLSSLGDVFNALAQGATHVPYRNSKLTYLLQDCLSGDGKALMFVNLSPTLASSNESLCSLRFAHRVNQVELGKPTKHIQYKQR